jgi:hypothetical protein
MISPSGEKTNRTSDEEMERKPKTVTDPKEEEKEEEEEAWCGTVKFVSLLHNALLLYDIVSYNLQ